MSNFVGVRTIRSFGNRLELPEMHHFRLTDLQMVGRESAHGRRRRKHERDTRSKAFYRDPMAQWGLTCEVLSPEKCIDAMTAREKAEWTIAQGVPLVRLGKADPWNDVWVNPLHIVVIDELPPRGDWTSAIRISLDNTAQGVKYGYIQREGTLDEILALLGGWAETFVHVGSEEYPTALSVNRIRKLRLTQEDDKGPRVEVAFTRGGETEWRRLQASDLDAVIALISSVQD